VLEVVIVEFNKGILALKKLDSLGITILECVEDNNLLSEVDGIIIDSISSVCIDLIFIIGLNRGIIWITLGVVRNRSGIRAATAIRMLRIPLAATFSGVFLFLTLTEVRLIVDRVHSTALRIFIKVLFLNISTDTVESFIVLAITAAIVRNGGVWLVWAVAGR
jgi:hypothetical protein